MDGGRRQCSVSISFDNWSSMRAHWPRLSTYPFFSESFVASPKVITQSNQCGASAFLERGWRVCAAASWKNDRFHC